MLNIILQVKLRLAMCYADVSSEQQLIHSNPGPIPYSTVYAWALAKKIVPARQNTF